MSISIHNLTGESLVCQFSGRDEKATTLPTHSLTSLVYPKRIAWSRVRISIRIGSDASDAPISRGYVFKLDKIKMRLGVLWNIVHDESPWRVYRFQDRHKSQALVLLPKRDLTSFLADMPDSLPLSSLLLPGTHDTMAFYGWPISQCQSIDTPLSVQLNSGIRVLDIRLAVIKSRLIAFHGLYPEKAPFQQILATIHSFLTSESSSGETIVMSIKQEDYQVTSAPVFSALVHEELYNGPGGRDMWYLDNRVPTLGEVRGKVVMLSRFGGNGDGWEGGLEGLGMHPTTWPDSDKFGFSWQCKNTVVRTHDWYAIPSFLSIPEKVTLSTRILIPPEPPYQAPFPILSISFLSAASFPLAAPSTIARGFGWPNWGFGVEGVNSRVAKWLLDKLSSIANPAESQSQLPEDNVEKGSPSDEASIGNRGPRVEPRVRGWVFMDFYTDPIENGIVPLLVECNYRGRRVGEEGW